MLFTTHAISGAAIGSASGNPFLGFLGGFLSHHLLDSLPHFDQGSFYTIKAGAPYLGIKRLPEKVDVGWSRRDWSVLFIDWFLATALFAFVFYYSPFSSWSFIAIGALGGLMPDIIDSSPLWSKKLRAKIKAVKNYHAFHIFFHWTVATSEAWLGLLTQLVVIFLSLWYLASLAR